MAEGQTATNPQTGERVILRGGQWVPLGGAAPRPQASRQPVSPLSNPVAAITQAAGGARISSGYRDPARNRAAGGVANSYHTRGQALDLVPQPGETMAQLEARLRQSGLPLRELLNEGDHVHVAWEGSPLSPDMTADYFANGGAVQSQAQPQQSQRATNPQTGEVVEFVNGAWVPAAPMEVEVDTAGIRTKDGKTQIYDLATDSYYDATPDQVAEYQAGLRQSQSDRQARLARQADPEYQRAIADARRGSAAVPERLRALGLGGTLGFLTDINATAQGALQGLENAGRRVTGQEIEYGADMAAQAARDSERDAQAAYAAENPVENFGLQLAGGLLTPGIGQAGRWIESADGLARLGRAAGVGAGVGIASGIGNSEGNLIERLPDGAASGLVGAGAGVIGQRAVDAVSRRVSGQGGGAARRLSRAGVDLKPGQMMAETPVVGQFIRNLEDVAGGFNPLISGVNRRQNEQVVRAAGNEAVGYIGETLPRSARTGYQVSQAVRRVLGDRYDDVTSRITAQADQQVYDEYADLTRRAAEVLDDSNRGRLARILDNSVFKEFTTGGQLSGANFKRIETALRQQSERASRPTSTLADNDLAEFLDEARDIARGLIARQHPEEAATIQSLNRGWATNKIIERAVTGSAGFSREGTPTPGEISQAVVNSSNMGAIANENALLQGLATDARTVLPSTVPDSGTAQKALLAGSVGAIGTGAVATFNPALAGMIATGAVVYSRPGIAALNAVYRATDSRAANGLVRQLAQQAQENPALIPYYEAAAQHVAGLARTDTQATPQAPPSAPVPSAALQRVMQ